jgi:hypothetical protein
MSDINAIPEVPVVTEAAPAAVLNPNVPAAVVAEPAAPEASTIAPPAVLTGDATASLSDASPSSSEVGPGEVVAATPEETLLQKIEALPAESIAVLHDALTHIETGLQEVSLMIGMGRLVTLVKAVRAKL